MLRKTITFFDKLEDKIRGGLSHWPITYAFVGGVGIILFWKGVWETAEYYPSLFGPASALLGLVILLASGLLVSFFIGDSIILSGLKHEKKLVERTETEVRTEEDTMVLMLARLDQIEKKLDTLSK
jgi:hypothetical protein